MRPGDRPSVHPQKGPYAPLPKALPPTAFGRPVGAPALLAGARVLVVEDDASSERRPQPVRSPSPSSFSAVTARSIGARGRWRPGPRTC
jgi:hypothetical protein